MPLKGTKREQKHYRRIREEYPGKGKEYAARVARNIVRAHTPGGRKLKGTTRYGRTWGPPYSEPLTKQSAFYQAGVQAAMEKIGLRLPTGLPASLRARMLESLTGPYGEYLTRIPIQAGVGGVLGAGTGALADHPWKGALLGALGGAGAGLAVAGAPHLRRSLIQRLQPGVA